MKRMTVLMVAFVAFFSLGLASAQPGLKKNKRQEVEEKLKAYRHYVLQQELGIDDATAEKLFAATDPLIDQMRDLRADQKKIQDDIELEAAKIKPDDKKLNELLDALGKNELAFHTARIEAFDKTKDVLTPLQRVQLLKTLTELDRKIREMIREVKKGPKAP
jgi:Spy/CpxP family protein refolding chaperone